MLTCKSNDTGRVSSSKTTSPFSRAPGLTINASAGEGLSIKRAECTTAILRMIRNMDRVITHTARDPLTLVFGKEEWRTEREFLSGLLVINTMESGQTTCNMAKAPMSFLMVESMMAIGKKIKSMVSVDFSGQTVKSMKVSGV